jgi:glucokinase
MARNECPTPKEDGPAAVVDACLAAARRARADAPAEVASEIAGIGISSPGPVDPARGIVVEPPNLGPAFRDIPLAAALADSERLPAFLDRDTNVAALGERAFGAARDCDDFIYLTVSTGVGGAIMTGGRLLHGPDGFAGELGHVPVGLEGPRCGCGGIGHVEAYAAGASLAREAKLLLAADASPFLADRVRDLPAGEEVSARDVGDGAQAGDPACVRLMDRARRAVAAGCVGYVNAFNPHRIVIGGAIAEAEGERLLDTVRQALATEVFEVLARPVRVVPAGLGGDVSLAGAQPLVMARLDDDPITTIATPRPAQPVAIPGGTPA